MRWLMGVLVLIGVCLICNINLFASGALSHSQPNPLRKPGGCYEDNTGHLSEGQEITVPGRCVRASCGSGGSITFASCGKIVVKGCPVREPDLTKSYPECCPRPHRCKSST